MVVLSIALFTRVHGRMILRTSAVGRAFLCKGASEQAPPTTLLAQRLVDRRYRGRRILHLYDQLGVAFVLEPDHHRLLGVMHVPEHALTLLVEGARHDDPRHVRSTDPGASPPPLRFLRIGLGTHYVRERDLQATPESPQLVHVRGMDNQGVFGKLHFGHGRRLLSCILSLACPYHPTRRSLALASDDGFSTECVESEFCEVRLARGARRT